MRKKAQSIIEYAIIISVVITALIGTCVYLQRSVPPALTPPSSLTPGSSGPGDGSRGNPYKLNKLVGVFAGENEKGVTFPIQPGQKLYFLIDPNKWTDKSLAGFEMIVKGYNNPYLSFSWIRRNKKTGESTDEIGIGQNYSLGFNVWSHDFNFDDYEFVFVVEKSVDAIDAIDPQNPYVTYSPMDVWWVYW